MTFPLSGLFNTTSTFNLSPQPERIERIERIERMRLKLSCSVLTYTDDKLTLDKNVYTFLYSNLFLSVLRSEINFTVYKVRIERQDQILLDQHISFIPGIFSLQTEPSIFKRSLQSLKYQSSILLESAETLQLLNNGLSGDSCRGTWFFKECT